MEQFKLSNLRNRKNEEKVKQYLRDLSDTWTRPVHTLWESQKEKRKGARRIFERIVAPNLTEYMNLQIW